MNKNGGLAELVDANRIETETSHSVPSSVPYSSDVPMVEYRALQTVSWSFETPPTTKPTNRKCLACQ